MKLSVPYLKLRDGRPRWEPGPALRAAGFKGRDLRDEGGGWLDTARAIERAHELNREVTAWREAGAPRRRLQGAKPNPQSLAALWERYQKTPEFLALRRSTRDDYMSKSRVFLAAFGAEPVAALTREHMRTWWEQLHDERSHAIANGVIAVLRLVLSYGTMIGWLRDNPCARLKMRAVEPRLVVWTPEEAAAAVAMADYLNVPSIGDAIVVALHLGQRQGDVLSLELSEIVDGRARFVQAKTGARVTVPLTPLLMRRVADIMARRQGRDIAAAHARRLILREDGQPYDRYAFGKSWRMVRAMVAETIPGFAEKKFLDLRDTAVTRYATAGCTMPQIAAISGHSLETINQVMRHYLALNADMASSGVERLDAWMSQQGVTV